MTHSKELFELIKSLNKGERRHFSNYALLHSSANKNYMRLFSAIDRQKDYDESKIIHDFKHHNFSSYFPVAKNYLYGRILDSLANFHTDISANAKVRTLIQQIELLQKRGLYSHSKKIISKAKKIARTEELHSALLEVISVWELNILIENYEIIEADKLFIEIKTILNQINETAICNHTFLKILGLYYRYYSTRNKKYLSEAKKEIGNPEFIRAQHTAVFKGRQRAIEANMFYCYIKGSLDQVSKYAKMGIEHNYLHRLGLQKDCKQYFVLLNNYFVIMMERKKYKEALTVLKKFDDSAHYAKTYSQKGGHYYTNSNCLLFYYRTIGDIKEIENRLPAILKHIDVYKKDINLHDRAILLSNISVSQFFMGKYKKCLYYLHKLKTEYDLTNHPELQYGYYLLSLIAHYESGNYDVLPYALNTFYRFLKKKTEVTRLEKLLLELCKKLIRTSSEKETMEELKKFRVRLAELKEDYVSHHISKLFDLKSWLDSKISKKSMEEIIRLKTNGN